MGRLRPWPAPLRAVEHPGPDLTKQRKKVAFIGIGHARQATQNPVKTIAKAFQTHIRLVSEWHLTGIRPVSRWHLTRIQLVSNSYLTRIRNADTDKDRMPDMCLSAQSGLSPARWLHPPSPSPQGFAPRPGHAGLKGLNRLDRAARENALL